MACQPGPARPAGRSDVTGATGRAEILKERAGPTFFPHGPARFFGPFLYLYLLQFVNIVITSTLTFFGFYLPGLKLSKNFPAGLKTSVTIVMWDIQLVKLFRCIH